MLILRPLPLKAHEWPQGNLRTPNMEVKSVSDLGMGVQLSCIIKSLIHLSGGPCRGRERDATAQWVGGHKWPWGWPSTPRQDLSLSLRSEAAACPVISVHPANSYSSSESPPPGGLPFPARRAGVLPVPFRPPGLTRLPVLCSLGRPQVFIRISLHDRQHGRRSGASSSDSLP